MKTSILMSQLTKSLEKFLLVIDCISKIIITEAVVLLGFKAFKVILLLNSCYVLWS